MKANSFWRERAFLPLARIAYRARSDRLLSPLVKRLPTRLYAFTITRQEYRSAPDRNGNPDATCEDQGRTPQGDTQCDQVGLVGFWL
jgi:hypothetical protein